MENSKKICQILKKYKKTNFIKTIKTENLIKDKFYKISNLKHVTTNQFGDQIVAIINKKYSYFLPKRMVNPIMNNFDLRGRTLDVTLYMKYIGSTKELLSTGEIVNVPDLEFYCEGETLEEINYLSEEEDDIIESKI